MLQLPLCFSYSRFFPVNPSLNNHQDDMGMGRGFGRGFRGRGGMVRPGFGRAEMFPPEMAMATPWMGKLMENLCMLFTTGWRRIFSRGRSQKCPQAEG